MRRAWQIGGWLAAGLLLAGCGAMTRTAVDGDGGRRYHYPTRAARAARVGVGAVRVTARLDPDLQPALARYLQHQATSALGAHDIFEATDQAAAAGELLSQFMAPAPATATAALDAELQVEVLALRERKGATVRVGLLSQQQKYAEAELALTLRLRNGRTLRTTAAGRASKGAWGVVAMTQRRAMDRGGLWQLDGSMAGSACALALQSGMRELALQLHRQLRRLKPAAAEEWFQPEENAGWSGNT